MKFTFASSALVLFAGIQFAAALPAAAPEEQSSSSGGIFARQAASTDGTCGWQNSGSKGYRCTTAGYMCCSQWGWCGSSSDHCGVGCQSGFGTCSNTPPPTTTPPPTNPPPTNPPPTTGRPRLGSVAYGVNLYGCTVPNTVALTFDDGPFSYTPDLITLLNNRGVKATFFINGANWGAPITDPAQAQIIRNAYNSGHQIASHTWSHPDLSTLDAAGIRSQMNQLESALINTIGRFPTYMRPPYLSCGSTCLSTLNTLGYHIISTNLDTNDWRGDVAGSRSTITNSLYSGSLVLAHDVHSNTVYNLAAHMIDTARGRGLRVVTVGECLGDPVANWYRTSL